MCPNSWVHYSNIEHKVDSVDQTTAFALRIDEERYIEIVKKIFNGKRRAQVYLAANNRRGVQEIADLIGIPQPNVNRELSALSNEGLVDVIEKEGGKTYWGKKPIDRTLKISQLLMKQHNLDKDGIPVK